MSSVVSCLVLIGLAPATMIDVHDMIHEIEKHAIPVVPASTKVVLGPGMRGVDLYMIPVCLVGVRNIDQSPLKLVANGNLPKVTLTQLKNMA